MKNKIREIRFKKGLTLADVWLKTRIHQSKLSQIEREIFEPSNREMGLISKALGRSVKEVFPE